ncbi:MAG: triose-phosphate isomerase [Rickettsiales bacterium]|jgi:triosephosphate isomerase|nr:triose-phosphate isomerase [Rickettsiales bacterium]
MKIVSGNWKMNGSKILLDQWFNDFSNVASQHGDINQRIDVILCVPAIYLEYALLKASEHNKNSNIKVNIGAEDVHYLEKGAYTGDTSPIFLKEFGCNYTLVGHSERRQYHGENDDLVSKKSLASLTQGITPIVCVGESLSVREEKKHLAVIEEQVMKSTNGLDLYKIIIAYEPVWAIGTGKVPTIAEISEMGKHIKDILNNQNIKVLYGGSVNGANASEMLHLQEIDGVLVGGASLKGGEFFEIVKGQF